ncbi:MAG: hypothetical protein RIT32_1059 [Actinomycetota bacterium]
MISAVLVLMASIFAFGVTNYPRFRLIKSTPAEVDEIDWMRGIIDALRAGATPSEALGYHKSVLLVEFNLSLPPDQLTDALANIARQKNSLLLKALAACWQVSQSHGAPLAPALQSALDAQLDRMAVSAEVKSQLAGPKSAAVTLALLPIATLLLAQSLGIPAITWLISSVIGLIVLALGCSLLGIGTWIMFQLAGRIEQELRL